MQFDDPRAQLMFRSRFEESPVPQALVAPDGVIRIANEALGELLGRSPEALAGMRPRDLRHETDRGGADATIAALLAGEQTSAQAERIYRHANGDPVPVLIHLSALRSSTGDINGLNIYFQDLRVLRDSERRLELQEQFYAALGRHAADAAFLAEPNGKLLYVSPAVKALFGYDPESLVGLDSYTLLHPDDQQPIRAEVDAFVRDGVASRTLTFRARDAQGRWRWVRVTYTNLLHTPIGGIVCNVVDITDEREAEARLRVAQMRNQAIVETTREGIWVVTPDGRTEFANERVAEILGRPLSEIYERKPTDLMGETDALIVEARLRERRVRGDDQYELDYEHPDGRTRRLHIAATPFAFGDGAFFGTLAMIHDVTEQRRMEAELRHAALHDPLTGLPNRTLLEDRLEQALLRQTDSDDVVTLFFVDLDQFKFVNDSRGHDVGDQVLVAVAERLRSLVRPHETVARVGGDEFVILCTCDDEVKSEGLAARIIDALAEPILLNGHQVTLTASVGVAASPPHEPEDLLRYADTAMFAAKAAGRAQVRTFDRSLAEETERSYALAGDLRIALETDALSMHYQPVVELASGNVIGYEALARWTHPEQGEVAPATFVPVAEQMGLARSLDRWAVRRSIADLDRLREAGQVAPDTYVAVNLSAQHLAERDLEQSIVSATAAAGLPPRNISLEITEGAVMRDVAATARILNNLRDRGYRIAIDDFGTGHSSLAYLRNFPITALKVDRSFVKDMTQDEDVFAIVTSIIQLARAIGVDVIAEGVETLEQARELRHLGCTSAQGWLWSRAMPPEQIDRRAQYAASVGAPVRRRSQSRPEHEVLEEHGLVRLMALQREGASLATIAAALNSEGFLTPTGQRWHRNSVARALRDLMAES